MVKAVSLIIDLWFTFQTLWETFTQIARIQSYVNPLIELFKYA